MYIMYLSDGCGKDVEGRLETPVLEDVEVASDHGLENVGDDVPLAVFEKRLFAKVWVHLDDLRQGF